MRAFPSRLLLGSCLGLVSLSASCTGVNPPDPYLGAMDGSAFDALFRGGTPGCIAPRRGLGGATGLDAVLFYYLGALSRTQIDISNAADPLRTPPNSAYQISGCRADDQVAFDARTDNYVRTAQYPVLANASPEPTAAATYRPWHVVVPAAVRKEREGMVGCNDIKSQKSIEDRSGWDRDRKVFGQGDFDARLLTNWPFGYVLPNGDFSARLDLQVKPPSWDDVRGGKAVFKDWPMVNVATPVQRTTDAKASCPFASGSTARYPRFPGDPQATFDFPQGSWQRGLLAGYLDGGDVQISTKPADCAKLANRVQTGKPCSMAVACDMAAFETCSAPTGGQCMAPLPVCPVVNDVYVPSTELTQFQGAGTVDLTDVNGKRTADVLAIFSATPGQAGFSPICRLRVYDPAKLMCGRKEAEVVAPRPLCTAAEIAGTMGAVMAGPDAFVHCLFLQQPKS